MELFPSEYIHVGGDEAGKAAWKTCPKCQKRMQDEHLSNVDELQSYLIHRIELFLNAHGRKLLGWDEILQGGLAPNATVMSWRGEEGGIAAVRSGHQAIMTPGQYCYLIVIRMLRILSRKPSEDICHWRRFIHIIRFQIL